MNLKVSVIGAGSLGTAIAQLISANVDSVYLHARRKEVVEEIARTGYNSEYYPNLKLAENITPVSDYDCIKKCDMVFLCVPSSGLRSTLKKLSPYICKNCIMVSTAKGIEYPSSKTMSDIIREYFDISPVVFSGPNFAFEIAQSLFTAANISSDNPQNLEIVKKVLSTEEFKVKVTDDVIGTECCGVIKNINAIAYGICEGMNLNDNARYAVLTKGFNETKDIIEALGGKIETVDDYCGFGDLVLTSTSRESRNHTLGMLYGQKIVVDEKASGIIFEGKNSIMAIKEICDQKAVNSIIVNFVYDVMVNLEPPKLAFKKLWKKME
ncbi:NAD(P)H-dependent glycerol-3-phosphate dehydrogenase [Methanobacterium alcaliphilum]|uniref:NAD(P)H-dependent glycerol-3-phosphate dehydrogenase n=1 Tax=Methanobacterium alcaliphilum TaxID=392018 RepID=UPI00200A47A9|nr:NAD(P)H-dependent glycerol-3-phosphate dehydrogenase [Methanobacterium alcaliphilum]MCK9152264.1 NAD(P)H-dependent glycerol-3-phosphate dehydrogenase [Methanobacterium alcaliphilum]